MNPDPHQSLPASSDTTPLLPMDDAASELVFARFQDWAISRQLDLQLEVLNDSRARLEYQWDNTSVLWEAGQPSRGVACLVQQVSIRLGEAYRSLEFCFTGMSGMRLVFRWRVDGIWQGPVEVVATGKRQEVTCNISGTKLEAVELTFVAATRGPGQVGLAWFGLVDPEAREALGRRRLQWSPAWPGLLEKAVDWSRPRFRRGLLFDPARLETLRNRRHARGWKSFYGSLYKRATEYLKRQPEEQVGTYIPWSDGRYQRSWQRNDTMLFYEPLTLAVVGLVEQDERMLNLALRYLMTLVHTRHWCMSGEHRLVGSIWDQRCFTEELATTTVALLADWLDAGLTPRARELVDLAMWDKGLGIIERDMMKWEYVHHINQGPWFCRARILAGLLLEKAWPRMGEYVDRAFKELRDGLMDYVQDDGGIEEGVGYFNMTMTTALPGLLAYARARGKDPVELLPPQLQNSEHYLAVMSTVKPGGVLTVADHSYGGIIGDGIAYLAGLIPGGAYESFTRSALEATSADTYFAGYMPNGELGFSLGPPDPAEPKMLVPTFCVLKSIGQLTSFRQWKGHSVRVHFSGNKAHASHCHRDLGQILLEVDGEPLLIDRGMLKYDDMRAMLLKSSRLHNVLTPIENDGNFAEQVFQNENSTAFIPEGEGDEWALRASLELTATWPDHMNAYRRILSSPAPGGVEVEDVGTLRRAMPLAVHWQASRPFELDGVSATLETSTGVKLRLDAPWAERVEQVEDLVSWDGHPAWRLTFFSGPLRAFDFKTNLSLTDHE